METTIRQFGRPWMAVTMKCLSVRQPWAWAIIHAGKDVENRTWATSYRGLLAIHAGKGCTRAEYDAAAVEIERITGRRPPPLSELPRGCVVGMVEMNDCVTSGETENDWAQDGYCWWMLTNARACNPAVTRGHLGLFEVTTELLFPNVAVIAGAAETFG